MHKFGLLLILAALIFRLYMQRRMMIERREHRELTRRFWAVHEKQLALIRAGLPCGPKLTYDTIPDVEKFLSGH